MKHIFLAATFFFAAGSVSAADIIGSFAGPADYKNDNGETDTCTLDVSFAKEENQLTFFLSTLCTQLEFDQAVPFQIDGEDVYYEGEKVGMFNSKEIIVKGMKVENDVYSFRAALNEESHLDYSDKYCYDGETCEELLGVLAPRTILVAPVAPVKRHR